MSDYESGYDPKYGYNRNAFAHKTLPQKLVGKTVKLIALPIGLASEAIHHHKDKKRSASGGEVASPPSPSSSPEDEAYVNVPAEQADELIASGQAVPADDKEATHELVPEKDEHDGIERDEADWALDEVFETEATEQPPVYTGREEPVETLIQDIQPSKGTATSTSKKTPPKLPFPVILPQRRPGTKTRGFVRAYAPVLEESGIDQEMFLSFLKNFHKAAQANPIFDVIMVATAIAGFYPDIVVGLALQAVQIAAMAGQEIQERYRLNKFLTQANKEIFIPKGLYAMVVTYQPGSKDQPEVGTKTVDLGATAFAKYGDELTQEEKTAAAESEKGKAKMMDDMKEKMKQLRIASGVSHGEAEMPVTCAPLIFPALEAAAAGSSEKSSGFKASSKFVSDYIDRRAQAVYAIENPNSTLTTQVSPIAPQFKSRYADPNNHTNKHLFTLLTGGKWKAEPLGARRRYERAQRKAAEKRAQGIRETPSKRMLQENVLYLMVVNMPTEQELEEAKRNLAAAAEKKAAEKK